MHRTPWRKRHGVLFCLLFCSLAPARAHAQGIAPALQSDGEVFVRSALRVVTAPLRWDRSDLMGFGAAAATIGAASLLDGTLRDVVERNHEHLYGAARRVEVLGTAANFRVLGVLYLGGLVFGDNHARATTAEALASSVLAGALIAPIAQTAIGRSRPRAGEPVYTFRAFGGGHSLPSGHTTQAFAVASVIALEYPRTSIKILAYGTASAVAASRMVEGAHFLSDVIAGALLGHAVARAATIDGLDLSIEPDPSGLSIRVRF